MAASTQASIAREPDLAREEQAIALELDGVSDKALVELTRRVHGIDSSYRSRAEKMGQLHMCADENMVTSFTRGLDKPMRNASGDEQAFAAILEELRQYAGQRRYAATRHRRVAFLKPDRRYR